MLRDNGSMPVVLTLALAFWLAPPPKQLSIERPALHQFEDGPDLAHDFQFASGETLYFDFLIGGYQKAEVEKTGDQKIDLSWNIAVQDPEGIPVIAPQSGKIATELAAEDKKWMPKARAEIAIPPHAPSGTYKILITATDGLAKTSATREFTFQIRGHTVPPAPSLEIRGLGFYASEEAPTPLSPAAYRPGENVWIRFEIVGFRLGEKNAFNVNYGIAVLRSNGEQLFAQQDAAAEKGDSFYPRRYIPAGLSLNLQKDIRPGPYTVIITVRDAIGNTQAESRQVFTVE